MRRIKFQKTVRSATFAYEKSYLAGLRPIDKHMQNFKTPTQVIMQIANRQSAVVGPMAARDVPELSGFHERKQLSFAKELAELGFLSRTGQKYDYIDYDVRILIESLSVAGAIVALCSYQLAANPTPDKIAHLRAINARCRHFSPPTTADLIDAAWLDYHLHTETVRLSGNSAAWDMYRRGIKPAVWICAARYFDLSEAYSSSNEHDRMIGYIEAREAMRARDTAAFHFEDAMRAIQETARAESQDASQRRHRFC